MSEIPSTDDLHIAIVAAASSIAQRVRSGDTKEQQFEATLERFLMAYKAIRLATDHHTPSMIDVARILERMKKGS